MQMRRPLSVVEAGIPVPHTQRVSFGQHLVTA